MLTENIYISYSFCFGSPIKNEQRLGIIVGYCTSIPILCVFSVLLPCEKTTGLWCVIVKYISAGVALPCIAYWTDAVIKKESAWPGVLHC